jgi:hypothetical protein
MHWQWRNRAAEASGAMALFVLILAHNVPKSLLIAADHLVAREFRVFEMILMDVAFEPRTRLENQDPDGIMKGMRG